MRFCYNARGSLEETLSHLQAAFELAYIPDTLCAELQQESKEIEKMLNGYIAYLKRSKQGEHEPGAYHGIREELIPYEIELSQELGDIEERSS